MLSWFLKDSQTAADIYVDLGTANTLIAIRDEGIVLNEPSLVAYTSPTTNKRKILGIGQDAKELLNQNTGNVLFSKPVKDGVIADFDLTQEMLKYFINKSKDKKKFSRPKVVVSLPYGVTEVERRAVVDACKLAGAKQVYLIDEPMAAAIGSNLPIKSAQGSMIVDIGGGTTEVAIIALSDIVYCEAVRVGGHKIDSSIIQYFKDKRKILISDSTAEYLKISIGTAVPKKDIRTAQISGRDADTGMNKNIEVNSEEVGLAMSESIQEIIDAIHRAIEYTPPELVSDIIENGLILAGGGALIRDLDTKIQNEVRISVKVAENPLTAIARGGEKVLKDPELLEKIQIEA